MKYIKTFKFWITFCALFYTFLGFVFIPWFLTNKTAPLLKEKIGLHVEIGKAKFNPFTFKLEVNDLLLRDQNNRSVIGFKQIFIDYIPLGLLEKTILFQEVSIDSPKLYTTLKKDGTLNLENILPPIKEKADTTSKETTLPSIVLYKFNMKNGDIKFTDLRGETPFILDLGPYNFDAHDISTKKDDLTAHSFKTKIGKNGEILWEGGLRINPLSIYGEVNITNLNLPKLYSYVIKDFDALLENGTLDLTLPYQIDLSKDLKASINEAKLSLSNIEIINKTTHKTAIKIPKVKLDGLNLNWPEQQVVVNNIDIDNSSLFTRLNKNKDFNLVKLFESKAQKTPKEEKKSPDSKPWDFVLKQANINKANISFTDASLKQPVKSNLSDLSLHVKNISSQKDLPITYKLGSTLNQKTDIKLEGDMVQKTQIINSKIDLKNLHVKDFISYIDPFINFNINDGSIDIKADTKTDFSKEIDIKLLADTKINNLDINTKKGERLLSWKQLDINGIKYNHNPMLLDIKNLKLNEPFIRVHIDKNGGSNFANLVKEEKKSVKKQKPVTDSKPLKVKLGPMKMTNGSSDFSDLSLITPFKTRLHGLEGYFSTLDFESTTPSTMSIQGKIDKYGYTDIQGVILPFDIKKSAKLSVLLKNFDLTSVTPYSGKFVGYAIKSGKISMDLNYAINSANLKGSNKINIDTLNLGDKIQSPDAVNLPLGLAIALLKDSQGQIDIDLPVKGDMNNPEFSYGGVIWRAVGNMITGIVTAPFKFLGAMIGIEGDELKSIDFDKGSYLVISTEHEKLENLQKILSKRPNIKLELAGGYDIDFDTHELQKQKFKTIINAELYNMKLDTNSSKNDVYGTALKNLYVKDFSNTKYEELKKSFIVVEKEDNNSSKKSKVKKEVKIDIVSFNNKMQEVITQNIKIPEEKLKNLAKKRAESLKNTLEKTYKIDTSRIKILPVKTQKAKRDRWIETTIDIAI